MNMSTIHAFLLVQGDVLVCPKTQTEEKITRIERRSGGMLFVRTVRHDHRIHKDDIVQVIEKES